MFEELSLHILDIAMNALAADAKCIQIIVREDKKRDRLQIAIRDDGHGMDKKTLERVLSSAMTTKTSRKKPIGLGLALLRQTAEMCDGHFYIRSMPGKGTLVIASMRLSHVDRPPMGDLSTTILALCAASPSVDVQLHYRTDTETFRFSSQEGSHHEPRRTQEAQRKGAAAGCAA